MDNFYFFKSGLTSFLKCYRRDKRASVALSALEPVPNVLTYPQVVSETPERIQTDLNDVYEALKHIKLLASDLYMNVSNLE